MDWQILLKQYLPIIGEKGVQQLTKLLDDAAEDQEGWKKVILLLVGDALEQHGAKGLTMAVDAISALINQEKVPDISWANPRRASDIVALMQNAEADKKIAIHDFTVEVVSTMGVILGGLLKGIVSTL